LPIPRQTVGLRARLAESGDALPRPLPHVITRHIAEQQRLLARMPKRPFGEQKSVRDPLELDGIANN
jgi:hypothetical protein